MSTSESERIEPIATDEAEAEWQQFQKVENMANHWDRPGWTGGRRSYHWMITFENAPEVKALAAACQAELADLADLDLVPLDYLHVTIQGLGFTDEVSFAEIQDIRTAIESRAAQLSPFAVEVGPLAGSPGAVRLSVTPHESVRAIHRLIAAAASRNPGVPASRIRSSDAFVPHASVAYSSSSAPAADDRAGTKPAKSGVRRSPSRLPTPGRASPRPWCVSVEHNWIHCARESMRHPG
jgi:2'-5' RNA ligase